MQEQTSTVHSSESAAHYRNTANTHGNVLPHQPEEREVTLSGRTNIEREREKEKKKKVRKSMFLSRALDQRSCKQNKKLNQEKKRKGNIFHEQDISEHLLASIKYQSTLKPTPTPASSSTEALSSLLRDFKHSVVKE